MFEHISKPLLSRGLFYRRVFLHFSYAMLAVVFALGMGVIGYRRLGELGWVDSVLNASMILGGMGPVNNMVSNAAKLFSAGYALFSGLFFVGVSALLVAPFAHRLLHALHMEEES